MEQKVLEAGKINLSHLCELPFGSAKRTKIYKGNDKDIEIYLNDEGEIVINGKNIIFYNTYSIRDSEKGEPTITVPAIVGDYLADNQLIPEMIKGGHIIIFPTDEFSISDSNRFVKIIKLNDKGRIIKGHLPINSMKGTKKLIGRIEL